jgi:hypothetical protein
MQPEVNHILLDQEITPACTGIHLVPLFLEATKCPALSYDNDKNVFGSGYVTVVYDGVCKRGMLTSFGQTVALLCAPEDGWTFEESCKIGDALQHGDKYNITAKWSYTDITVPKQGKKLALTLQQLMITTKGSIYDTLQNN